MLENRFSLLFYLKKPKAFISGPIPVYLRITVDGKHSEVSTGRICEANRWNSQSNRALGTKEDAKSLNAFLDILQLKVHDARSRALESNTIITASLLKNILKGKEDKPRMILEIFKNHNTKVHSLIGKDFTYTTYVRYTTSMEHTKSFIKWKYNVEDIDIKKLDYEFISDYCYWLKSVKNCNHNTALKYISNFRKIVNITLNHGWLTKNPFQGFKMSQKEVIRDILTKEEIQSIYTKGFSTDRLSQVRDAFLFACFTGLAYADIQKLKRSEIAIGIDGEQWIFTSRQKTETTSRIPLMPITLEILEKYKDNQECQIKDRVLPILSNQKMNAYLKEIADLCSITKNLTFHIARHTFATTVTMSNGVPIESISKMLGHKNLRTTQHYAKILDQKVSNDMRQLREKLQV